MVDPSLVDWIKHELKIYSESEVRGYLSKRGLPESEVDDVIRLAKGGEGASSGESPKPQGAPVRKESQQENAFSQNLGTDDIIDALSSQKKHVERDGSEKEDSADAEEKPNILDTLEKFKKTDTKEKTNKSRINFDIHSILKRKEIVYALVTLIVIVIIFSVLSSIPAGIAPGQNSPPMGSASVGSSGARNVPSSGNGVNYESPAGETESGNEITECIDYDCFNANFKSCSPAVFTENLNLGKKIYFYQIIKEDGGLCQVETRAIRDPDSSLNNMEMSCLYKHDQPFKTAFSNPAQCAGPLFDAMQNSGEELQINEKETLEISSAINAETEKMYNGLYIGVINFTINYTNGPVDLYIIEGYNKGSANPLGAKGRELTYRSFKTDEKTGFVYPERNFVIYEEGKFSFYFYVYNCTEIADELGRSCGYGIKEQVMDRFEPLTSAEKTIDYERPALPKCVSDADCATECKNCRTGQQKCISRAIPENRSIEYVCVECVKGYHMCSEGFECIENKCV